MFKGVRKVHKRVYERVFKSMHEWVHERVCVKNLKRQRDDPS